MTTLLFCRHAATDLAGTFCGASDPRLNPLGHEQAAELLTQLAPHPITAVYSSDLLRALETAAPLALAHHAPVISRPALRELAFGDWETLTWEDIEARDPAYAARWVAEFPALPAPNGEHIPAFRTRVLAELQHISREAPAGQTIAVVTHAGPLRVLLEEFGHYAPQHAWERTRNYTTVIRCTQTTPGNLRILD